MSIASSVVMFVFGSWKSKRGRGVGHATQCRRACCHCRCRCLCCEIRCSDRERRQIRFLYSTLQSHSRYRCNASASTRANTNIYATTNASSNNAGAQRNAPYANSLAQGAARRSIAGRLFHLLHGHPERGCGARRKDEVSRGKVPGRSVLGVSSSAGRQDMYLLCHLLLRELSVRAPTPR